MSYRDRELAEVYSRDLEEVLLRTIQKAWRVSIGLTTTQQGRVMEVIANDQKIAVRAASMLLDEMLTELEFADFANATQFQRLLDKVAALANES